MTVRTGRIYGIRATHRGYKWHLTSHVLSPHLDDAVLSCGALMNHARTETSVTVVTFFTEGAAPPYTYSVDVISTNAGDRTANSLFLARRAEDQAVLEGAGISYVHVGLKEILFRRRTQPLLTGFHGRVG